MNNRVNNTLLGSEGWIHGLEGLPDLRSEHALLLEYGVKLILVATVGRHRQRRRGAT